jgi:ArsR family metal-binding transcriptional regulator
MGDELFVTTCPERREIERAQRLLDAGGMSYRRLDQTPPLARVAVPALIMDRETMSRLREEAASEIVFSGWVEHRPSNSVMPDGPEPEAGVCFQGAAIMVLQPCVADETKIRLVAHLQGDLAPVLPYLNSVIRTASFTPAAETLTYMEAHRMVVLYPRRITIAKADDIVDAWMTLERIRRLAEETWANRANIEPCYVTRKKPPALEIFKRLPGTNCGLCGEPTCMAFAVRLWAGESSVRKCIPVFEPANAGLKEALVEIVAGMGAGFDEGER